MLRSFVRRLSDVQKEEKGFTLIELLVVILIIGILAAIALPAFLEQRERAWEATAQSDARNAAAAATSCSVPAGGSFLNCETVDQLDDFGFNKTQAVDIIGMDGSATNFSVTLQHENGGQAAQFTTWNTAGAGVDSNAGQVRLVARGSANPAAP